MARPDKAAAVAELSKKFTSSSGIVLTEYRGLSVKALKELRRSLGDNATYAVSKNTLTTIAAREAGVPGIEAHLVGPTAIAFVDGDAVAGGQGAAGLRPDPSAPGDQGRRAGREVPGARRGSQARGPGVARGAAGQGRRRDEGHPAAGDLVDLRTAVPDRPAAGRAGGGRQGEPLADRRPRGAERCRRGHRQSRAVPTWTRQSRSDADLAAAEATAEPSNAELPRRTPRHRRSRRSRAELAADRADSPILQQTGRCGGCQILQLPLRRSILQLPLRRSILQLPLQTRRRPSPPAIPRQRPLRKTTRKGRPSWRSSAPPSSLTPSRSSP